MEKILSKVKNIHLVGVGGIGMSGLALLLKEKGLRVSGSDLKESANTKMLEEEGINIILGQRAQNLSSDVELVAYSSAIEGDNPEILEARNRRIPVLKRGELLGSLCEDKKSIAIAGSHGKTTTTSLMGHLLIGLGFEPTVFVGGLPLNYSRNAWWGKDYFVIETDESDGSFLYCKPWTSIITNIDYEHLDYHKTMENLTESFLKFASQTRENVFGWADQPQVKQILSAVGGISFGFGKDNQVRAEELSIEAGCSCFSFIVEDKFVMPVKVPLLGEHNILNTLGVLASLFYLGVDMERIASVLKEFKGTKRRFQFKKEVAGVMFVDDYAHHPTEIQAVLKAARYLNPKRVFAVFQPHRFSRVKSLYNEFSTCFGGADRIIVTDIYAASEEIIEGVSSEFLTEGIRKEYGDKVCYIPKDRLKEEILPDIKEGDIVLGLGAVDINIVMEEVIREFDKNRAKA
ncbi:MAG: UDP-N-acetylmuramate--L-alanine ligase [Candidatus Omnitrophota bacterium]|nr:MAG: UDP-N-acetylmuramate--L-alanine ligase [Candidatus Omnitrophota bacterium]